MKRGILLLVRTKKKSPLHTLLWSAIYYWKQASKLNVEAYLNEKMEIHFLQWGGEGTVEHRSRMRMNEQIGKMLTILE